MTNATKTTTTIQSGKRNGSRPSVCDQCSKAVGKEWNELRQTTLRKSLVLSWMVLVTRKDCNGFVGYGYAVAAAVRGRQYPECRGLGGQKGITSKDGSGDDIGSLSRTTAPKLKRVNPKSLTRLRIHIHAESVRQTDRQTTFTRGKCPSQAAALRGGPVLVCPVYDRRGSSSNVCTPNRQRAAVWDHDPLPYSGSGISVLFSSDDRNPKLRHTI